MFVVVVVVVQEATLKMAVTGISCSLNVTDSTMIVGQLPTLCSAVWFCCFHSRITTTTTTTTTTLIIVMMKNKISRESHLELGWKRFTKSLGQNDDDDKACEGTHQQHSSK